MSLTRRHRSSSIFWAAAVAFISVGRAVARAVARRNIAYLQNTVIVGAGDVGQLIARKLLNHPEYGINLVGFVDAQPKERGEDSSILRCLATRAPAGDHSSLRCRTDRHRVLERLARGDARAPSSIKTSTFRSTSFRASSSPGSKRRFAHGRGSPARWTTSRSTLTFVAVLEALDGSTGRPGRRSWCWRRCLAACRACRHARQPRGPVFYQAVERIGLSRARRIRAPQVPDHAPRGVPWSREYGGAQAEARVRIPAVLPTRSSRARASSRNFAAATTTRELTRAGSGACAPRAVDELPASS